MEPQTTIIYDRICLGRISPVQVRDGKRFNDEMNRGVDFDAYMSYEEHVGIILGKPFQVYEYIVDGVWYRRAYVVTLRNSELINNAMYGKECVVIYNSVNPGYSCLNKNISIEQAKEKYHLYSLEQKWSKPIYKEVVQINSDSGSKLNQQSISNQNNQGYPDVNEPYIQYTSYETTNLEKVAIILGLCSAFFGLFIWILGPIAIIISAKSLNTQKRNRNYAYTGLFLGILGTVESVMGLFMALVALLSIIMG